MTRCHAAAAEEDEEEDDDGLCSAWKGVLGGREREKKREIEREDSNAPITTAFVSVNCSA